MKNYSTFKLELLALKWVVTDKLKDYLWGSNSIVCTDNNLVSYLRTSAKLRAIEQCWAGQMAIFNIEIRHQ